MQDSIKPIHNQAVELMGSFSELAEKSLSSVIRLAEGLVRDLDSLKERKDIPAFDMLEQAIRAVANFGFNGSCNLATGLKFASLSDRHRDRAEAFQTATRHQERNV
jgi:hypothetical protein